MSEWRRLPPSIVLVGLLLAGCTTVPSSRLMCPELVQYPAGQQARLAQEMEEATGKIWPTFIRDYGLLRDQCRAIEKD